MTVSQFLHTGKNYLNEAAQYLQDRGLSIQDCPISPYQIMNNGLVYQDGTPFLPEGWAYLIQNGELKPAPDQFLMRVCNWPADQLYRRTKDGLVECHDRPKFLGMYTGNDRCILHYCCKQEDVSAAAVVTLHEKITSATLCYKATHIPSVAISGCTGWSAAGLLAPKIQALIKAMAPDSKLVVCFDGDVIGNPNITIAAARLKGAVNEMRKDISVTIPQVPENDNGIGWDDWGSGLDDSEESLGMQWIQALAQDIDTIDSALSPAYLVKEYGLAAKVLRNGGIQIQHSYDNYRRLCRHPHWDFVVRNIDRRIFNRYDLSAAPWTMEQLALEYQCWLERCIFRNDQAAVRSTLCYQAWEVELQFRDESVPIMLLEEMLPITEEEADAAALRLITEGIKVTGPMTQEQTIYTLKCMARDMIALWSTDPAADVQWVCALVGPSGCGKSNFPISMIRAFDHFGFHGRTCRLAKDGTRAQYNELYLQCEQTMAATFDEYNPNERVAKDIEQNLFTLSSSRTDEIRRPYGRGAEIMMRHAALFLTTVDKNRKYIRTGKGDGSERRYITLEVEGAKLHGSIMSSDRPVISECWQVLFRWGYQMWMAGNDDLTVEYSRHTAIEYIDKPQAEVKAARACAGQNMVEILKEFGRIYRRDHTHDWRFTTPSLEAVLFSGENLTRGERAEFRDMLLECGAKIMKEVKINQRGGGEVKKDSAFVVADWQKFCEKIMARL